MLIKINTNDGYRRILQIQTTRSFMYLKIISMILINIIRKAHTNKGAFSLKLACANQNPFPITESTNIHIDISAVIFVLKALINCGKNIMVVKIDANQPNNSVKSI